MTGCFGKLETSTCYLSLNTWRKTYVKYAFITEPTLSSKVSVNLPKDFRSLPIESMQHILVK